MYRVQFPFCCVCGGFNAFLMGTESLAWDFLLVGLYLERHRLWMPACTSAVQERLKIRYLLSLKQPIPSSRTSLNGSLLSSSCLCVLGSLHFPPPPFKFKVTHPWVAAGAQGNLGTPETRGHVEQLEAFAIAAKPVSPFLCILVTFSGFKKQFVRIFLSSFSSWIFLISALAFALTGSMQFST